MELYKHVALMPRSKPHSPSVQMSDALPLHSKSAMPRLIEDPLHYNPYRRPGLIPGLTDKERGNIREILTDAIIENLDTTQAWTKQSPDAVNKYMDQAARALPCLSRFESGWPAKALGQAMLQRRSRIMPAVTPASRRMPPPAVAARIREIEQVRRLNDHERQVFSHVMVKEAGSCFELGLPWHRQTKDAQKVFMKRMSEQLPFLDRFVDAWPAQACVKTWLKKHSGRCKSSRSPSVEILSMTSHSSHRAVKPKLEVIDLTSSSRSTGVQSNPITAHPYITSELAAILKEKGIETMAHLDAFSRWPRLAREKFMKEKFHLTEFQEGALRLALDEGCKGDSN